MATAATVPSGRQETTFWSHPGRYVAKTAPLDGRHKRSGTPVAVTASRSPPGDHANPLIAAPAAMCKGGFGGDEVDFIGTVDRPLRPLSYRAWQTLWPLAKPVGRALRRRRS
ncbi:MAG: hypothetical protein M3Y74_15025 [Chloroflexota bacterium]|nr:hypothetical protein [Chloroflexota bacterium]